MFLPLNKSWQVAGAGPCWCRGRRSVRLAFFGVDQGSQAAPMVRGPGLLFERSRLKDFSLTVGAVLTSHDLYQAWLNNIRVLCQRFLPKALAVSPGTTAPFRPSPKRIPPHPTLVPCFFLPAILAKVTFASGRRFFFARPCLPVECQDESDPFRSTLRATHLDPPNKNKNVAARFPCRPSPAVWAILPCEEKTTRAWSARSPWASRARRPEVSTQPQEVWGVGGPVGGRGGGGWVSGGCNPTLPKQPPFSFYLKMRATGCLKKSWTDEPLLGIIGPLFFFFTG